MCVMKKRSVYETAVNFFRNGQLFTGGVKLTIRVNVIAVGFYIPTKKNREIVVVVDAVA